MAIIRRCVELLCRKCRERWYERLKKGEYFIRCGILYRYEIRKGEGVMVRIVSCPGCGETKAVMRPRLPERRRRYGRY